VDHYILHTFLTEMLGKCCSRPGLVCENSQTNSAVLAEIPLKIGCRDNFKQLMKESLSQEGGFFVYTEIVEVVEYLVF